ncbi:MAG: nucleotide exchange factor GrpE [Paludibacteraceae bacterium]|nr:nucleotide exchange factor GrpE [Paludibacteraceae bacterium]MBO7234478.1 nucleotide exchange factor GrpE [Paludibacteraceae bacterium]MBO7259031.1 nucleotide exchange factor GrpE [Paludibacteraceae bacterium]
MKQEKDDKNTAQEQVINQETPQNEQNTQECVSDNQDIDQEIAHQEQISQLTEKCAELTDKNLRLMAEFDNYRRRTLKEKSDIIKNAGENIFKDMLPLVDDFERALTSIQPTPENASLREGVEIIYNKFINFLGQNGVKAIDTENKVFDVEFHEAITTIPAPEESMKGKIIDCTTKGYTLNEKVIRFAKVVVGE